MEELVTPSIGRAPLLAARQHPSNEQFLLPRKTASGVMKGAKENCNSDYAARGTSDLAR